ncbi:DMT family transporter [Variovorax rhizosphaerae]|uniref:DMT family transporter n=1 Tax=Variovorax rhizosphaerae TaxID=1836200 RepID=A0ABU8WRN4_9BURK
MTETGLHRGVIAALGAAVLFGAGTPLAKLLLSHASPWMLAGLLYLGSGLGLWLWRSVSRSPRVVIQPGEAKWLGGAVVAGGLVGPLLLMTGLSGMAATDASLLLNAEGVFTALLAWFAFRENFDRQIALGMLAIVAGAVVLSRPGEARVGALWPSLAVLGACAAWALDNNLTRKVSGMDASFIAMTKGLAAGATNLAVALAFGAKLPSVAVLSGAAVLGLLSYGTSLVLFVIALRHLGTARTGAYFSVAPFFGAVLSIMLLGEPVTLELIVASALMAFGVWLHIRERHVHPHVHEPMEHEHAHTHDEHHRHHADGVHANVRHSHWHRHEPLEHAHAHHPDIHHRHDHPH